MALRLFFKEDPSEYLVSEPNPSDSTDDGLSSGEVAGVTVGVMAGAGLVGAAGYMLGQKAVKPDQNEGFVKMGV